MHCAKQWVMGLVVSCVALPVYAQGRAGVQTSVNPSVDWVLEQGLRVGDDTVYPGPYKLLLQNRVLMFVDPKTMVIKTKILLQESLAQNYVQQPKVEWKKTDKKVKRNGVLLPTGELRFFVFDKMFSAVLAVDQSVLPVSNPTVAIQTKKNPSSIHERDDAESDVVRIQTALKKYGKSVVQCAERALSVRWETDDPKFKLCVCPVVQKWRLPKTADTKRVHHFLVKGRWGFSFTLSAKGVAEECRVWSGAKPPKNEKMSDFPIGWMGYVKG